MVAQLDHFHQLAVGAGAGHLQSVGGELLAELVVELVAMPVPLVDQRRAVSLMRLAPLHQRGRIRPQPHGAPLVGDGVLLVEHANNGVTAIAVELGAIGVLQADHIAGELDDGALQAQADAEEGDFAFAGMADGVDLAAGAAVIETAGNKDAVQPAENSFDSVALDFLGFNLANHGPAVQADAGMVEGLVNGFVSVVVLDVLANDGDGDFVGRVLDALQHLPPVADFQRRGPQTELLDDQLVQAIFHKTEGNLIDAELLVTFLDDGARFDIAEEGDLVGLVLGQLALGAANEDVRLNTDLPELAD